MKTVAQVMTTGVVTVEAGRSVADATALMLDHHVGVLPVVDGECLIGLITIRDLLRALPYRPVVAVMQRDVTVVSGEMPITGAYMLMEEQRVGQLPVVDQGRVAGLITIESILRELGLPIDPLTELPWGAALRRRAVEDLKDGREIAIVFFDLDNFGQVNKQLGHVMGDRWIQAVTETLRVAIHPSQDLLCRYGGDEFAILTTRGRDEVEALGRQALEAISALRLSGMPEEFVLTASLGFAGGKRTNERQDVHYEATVDDLITIASRQTTQAKAEKFGRVQQAAAAQAEAAPRLLLRRVSLSFMEGEATTAVELSLGSDRYVGEATGPGMGTNPWRLLAEATMQAINHVLPDGWRGVVDEVRILTTDSVTLVAVTVHLGKNDGTSDRYVGSVLADTDVGQAVVKAMLQATNRRIGRLLAGSG
jgi:IMP dehydrogenase